MKLNHKKSAIFLFLNWMNICFLKWLMRLMSNGMHFGNFNQVTHFLTNVKHRQAKQILWFSGKNSLNLTVLHIFGGGRGDQLKYSIFCKQTDLKRCRKGDGLRYISFRFSFLFKKNWQIWHRPNQETIFLRDIYMNR